MNFIETIKRFFEKIFFSKKEVKMLNEPINISQIDMRKKFIESLRTKKEKKEIETLISPGDGLGITTKIRY